MSDIISKITSYNLFNNLVPGVVFSYAVSSLGITTIGTGNIPTDFIMFYFLGVMISRFGSLFVEPALRYMQIAIYSDYNSYLTACAEDKKIEILVEDNNQYRTYISLFVLLTIALSFDAISSNLGLTDISKKVVILIATLFLFIAAYRKQTFYIYRRVLHINSRKKATDD